MARPREPIALIEAKGKKHIGKEDAEARRASEPKIFTEDIAAPEYLNKRQKDRFNTLSRQLQKIKIMGETDCETLARYVVAEDFYEKTTKKLRRLMQQSEWDPIGIESLSKLHDRWCKQASTLARDLGLTISSRCKLVVPVSEEPEKVNKFAKFSAS